MMSEFPEHTEHLLRGLFEGTLSEEERSELDRLKAADPDIRAAAQSIERLAERIPGAVTSGRDLSGTKEIDESRTNAAWQSVADRAGIASDGAHSVHQSERPPMARIHVLYPRIAMVAAVVMVAVMGWLWLAGPGEIEWKEVATERGQLATVTLPDGSEVRLNAASSLRYRMGEGVAVREVHLAGEALFDVQPGVAPFEVHSSETLVRVLGTRFTVRSRSGVTRVAVQEGRVSVGEDTAVAVLTRSEAAEVAGTAAPVLLDKSYADRADDWSEGILSFTRAPFMDVMQDVEVRFDVSIRVDGSWAEEATLSGSFPGQDVDQVLTGICSSFGCRVIPPSDEDRVFRLER